MVRERETNRRFMSVWLPTFAVDRLRRASRRWFNDRYISCVPDDQPFVLVLPSSRGLVITAANQTAREEGIHIGQVLADARAAIPSLLTRPGEPEQDRRKLHALAYGAGRYGPARNVEGPDGLWVDITGVSHLFGGERQLSQDCIERLRQAGFHAQIGIADTLAAAFILARYGAGRRSGCDGVAIAAAKDKARQKSSNTLSLQATADAIASLPVEGLRLETQTIILLKRLGLRSIGQLYDIPRSALTRRFRDLKFRGAGRIKDREGLAQAVLVRLDLALGREPDPRRSLTEPPHYIVRQSYPDLLMTSEGLEAACQQLAAELCAKLAAHHKGARRLRFPYIGRTVLLLRRRSAQANHVGRRSI